MVRELLGRLGYEVEIVVLGNWKRCLMDAAAGRVDVVLAYNSDQRDQGMRFSTVPVLREEVAVFVNQRRPVRFEHWTTWPATGAVCSTAKAMGLSSTVSWRGTKTSNGCPPASRTSAS